MGSKSKEKSEKSAEHNDHKSPEKISKKKSKHRESSPNDDDSTSSTDVTQETPFEEEEYSIEEIEEEGGEDDEDEDEEDQDDEPEEQEVEVEEKKARKREKKRKKKKESAQVQEEEEVEGDEEEEVPEEESAEEDGGQEQEEVEADAKKARKRDKKRKKKERKKRYSCTSSDTDSASSAGSCYYHNYDSDSSSLSSGSELSLLSENLTKKKFLKGVRKEASKASLLDSASIANGSFRRYLTSDDEGDASSEDDEISEIGLPVALLDNSAAAQDTASTASARTAPPMLGAQNKNEGKDKGKSKEKDKDKTRKKTGKEEKREQRKSLDEFFDQSSETGRHRKLVRKHSFDLDDIIVPKRLAYKYGEASLDNDSSKQRINKTKSGSSSGDDEAQEFTRFSKGVAHRPSSRKFKADGALRNLIESETIKIDKKSLKQTKSDDSLNSGDSKAAKKSSGQSKKVKNTEEEHYHDKGVKDTSKRHGEKKRSSSKSDTDDDDLDFERGAHVEYDSKEKTKSHSRKEKYTKYASDDRAADDAENESFDDAKHRKVSKKNKSSKEDDDYQWNQLDDSKEKRRHNRKGKSSKSLSDENDIHEELADDKEKPKKKNIKDKAHKASSDNIDDDEDFLRNKDKSKKSTKKENSKSFSDDEDDASDDKDGKRHSKKGKGVKYPSDDDSEAPKKRNKKDKSPEPETEEIFDWASKQEKLDDHEIEEVYDWSKQKKKDNGMRDMSEKESSVASKKQSRKEKQSKTRDGPSDVPPKSVGPLDLPPKKKSKDKKDRRPSTDEDQILKYGYVEPSSPVEAISGREKLLVDVIKQQRQMQENSSIVVRSPKKSPKKKKKESGKKSNVSDSLPQLPVLSRDASASREPKQRKVDTQKIRENISVEERSDEKLAQDRSDISSEEELERKSSEESDESKYHIWRTLAQILEGYSDGAMITLLDVCPQIAGMKFDTSSLPLQVPKGSSELYLLSILCCVGASRDVLSTCYDLYPVAIRKVDNVFGTPLHCALSWGVLAAADRGTSTDLIFTVLEYLVERDCSLLQSQRNSLSQSVLHTALLSLCASSGSGDSQRSIVANEVVSLLLDYYPSLAKLRDHQDMLPLHLAAKYSMRTEILERILRANFDACVCPCKTRGFTPLHYAAEAASETARNVHIAKIPGMEKESGAEGEEQQESMALPLQHHLSVVQALIQAGPMAAQVPDHDGRLPLHVAIHACKPGDTNNCSDILQDCSELFQSILEKLTKPFPDAANTPDNQGMIPLEEAEKRKASDSVLNAISLI